MIYRLEQTARAVIYVPMSFKKGLLNRWKKRIFSVRLQLLSKHLPATEKFRLLHRKAKLHGWKKKQATVFPMTLSVRFPSPLTRLVRLLKSPRNFSMTACLTFLPILQRSSDAESVRRKKRRFLSAMVRASLPEFLLQLAVRKTVQRLQRQTSPLMI